MDPENVGKETILKVTDWLRGVWEMRRRAGGPVQQWIDSIPLSTKSEIAIGSECREHGPSKSLTLTEPKDIPFPKDPKPPSMTVSAPINVPNSAAMNTPTLPRLARDASFQSDSSHCSSVESLLELRKADPTAILLDLGFGGCSASPQENGSVSRIPKRFLQPSSLQGIAIDEFLKQQQQSSESFDSVSLGYRGLTGSPYVAPSEIVQKIMDRLREHESHEGDTSAYSCEPCSPSQQNGRLSVLSPDNRQFLEQQRSRSPDMRNKRMIIGEKSFAFGCDGNLIEISTSGTKLASSDAKDDDDSLLDANVSIELKQSSPEESIMSHYWYFSTNDKKLTKQLSFDDTVEFPKADQLSKDNLVDPNSSDIAQSGTSVDDNKREYDASTPTCKKYEFPDVRTASYGSFDTLKSKFLKSKMLEERRFSDGAMRTTESQSKGSTLIEKRKSFKRQSRVCDTAAMHYCDLSPIRSSVSNAISESNIDNEEEEVSNNVTNSAHQLDTLKPFEPTERKSDLEPTIDTESSSGKPTCTPSPSRISESIDKIERSLATEADSAEEDLAPSDHSGMEDNQICCYKSSVCTDCKHGKNCTDCYCHADKRKYWKKMEKIMRENRKLEDMLARSRREMAEIRDMLSNVLSVRMEPGF
ncbi:uncharacterized protein olf186-M isoform X2 [Linepithema humile]|uniref:uncharacterized protein olf186-M isoform X2 n=1 Tax=Linepithema humile TaxID=83485 RepID=UPI00351ED36F